MKKGTLQITFLELKQSLRSAWFWVYSLLFGGFVAIMFALGITESQIIGFVGLGRLMVTFMQVSMVILPIYILITTVRAVVGDRETNIMEYILSLPISFSGYFWGKFISRFIEIFIPVFLALLGAAIWGTISNIDVPWDLFALYSFLLAAMVFCFLGIGMYISSLAHSQNLAISTAFILWLVLVAFLDLILMGVMLKMRMNPELVIGIGMINPLQVFRTAVLVLFDPKLTVMGPASFYILDTVSRSVFIAFSIMYPVFVGFIFAFFGVRYFKRNDIV
ncbi:MAG: ABC transporter permease [Bacteroidetes bacterium 4484_249]|nr:MAG: ABC transporter permease [Bacteroidetes bacterium 4484_249]